MSVRVVLTWDRSKSVCVWGPGSPSAQKCYRAPDWVGRESGWWLSPARRAPAARWREARREPCSPDAAAADPPHSLSRLHKNSKVMTRLSTIHLQSDLFLSKHKKFFQISTYWWVGRVIFISELHNYCLHVVMYAQCHMMNKLWLRKSKS